MSSESDAQPWIRAFIGIGISDALRASLSDAQAGLMQGGAQFGWTRPENMHLTLVFLGNIRPEVVADLPGALEEACGIGGPCACPVRGIGFFGGRRPRVIWAGVEDTAGRLDSLRRQIAETATQVGIPLETKPYTPHITLGRSRSWRGAAELAATVDRRRDLPLGELTIARVTLYKSVLSPGGAVYSVLHEVELSSD